MLVDECHVTRVNQGLFTTTMEAEKRDPGNEVEKIAYSVKFGGRITPPFAAI